MKYQDFKLSGSATYFPVGSKVYSHFFFFGCSVVLEHEVKMVENWLSFCDSEGNQTEFTYLGETSSGLQVLHYEDGLETSENDWDSNEVSPEAEVRINCRYYYTTLSCYNGHYWADLYGSKEAAFNEAKRKASHWFNFGKFKARKKSLYRSWRKVRVVLEIWKCYKNDGLWNFWFV